MALLHSMSCKCVTSELDLFSVPPTQTSIEHGQWVEYHPLAKIRDSGPIKFSISGLGEDYLNLANTLLYVRAQIVKADGTNLPKDAEVGPTNLWLHSLFSQVDVSLNEKLISLSTNTYPYRAYLERPAYGLFFQDRYMLNGVDMKIRLVHSKDAFALMAADASFKTRIKEAALFVRKVKLSPSIQLAHIKALEKGMAKFPIQRVDTKVFSIPRGNLSANQKNLFLGQLPKRLVIGIVENSALNGSFNRNIYNFRHYDLHFLALYADGQQIPAKPLQPKVEKLTAAT